MITNERISWAVWMLDIQPTDMILEIGCGVGIAVEQIAQKLTCRKGKRTIKEGKLCHHPDRFQSIVSCVGLLYHCPTDPITMNMQEKVAALGLVLPEVSKPGGSYVSVNVRSNIAYVAIQFPISNGEYLYQGRLGNEISTEEGYKAMQLCALNVIAQVHQKVGFDQVMGLNHIDAYFQSGENWDDAPLVVNGASDLFVKVLGDKGTHSRAIFGVDKLPRNFCVGLTCSFTLL